MRKGTDILNRPIIAFDTGTRIAQVLDLIFDQNTNQLLGLLVKEAGLFRAVRVVPLNQIKAIGPDVVVVPGKNAIVSANSIPEIKAVIKHKLVLKGNRVITTDGRNLGSVVDLYFDDQTGVIEGYETSGGLFADAYSGRSFIPAPQTVKIGEEVTFVPPETADLMEEQVGGIRGAVMTTGNQIQESAATASQKLQAATSAASDTLQAATDSANRKLQEAANSTSDRFDQTSSSAAAALTDQLVSPDEQFDYVIGRAVDRDIQSPDGLVLLIKDQIVSKALAQEAQRLGILDQLYRATGGSLTVGINRHLQNATAQAESRLQMAAESSNLVLSNAMARLGVEQANGRRVQQIVRSEDGIIVAAPGQIVTETVITRARMYNREAALLNAVGLQPEGAVRNRADGTLSDAGMKMREQAAIAQENAYTFWNNLKTQSKEMQRRSARALHKRRIEQALGRPVNRVILDPQDNVILNVGELITHKAVWQAEQGGVLNILLNSVYTRNPDISDAELRAPESGMASLQNEPKSALSMS